VIKFKNLNSLMLVAGFNGMPQGKGADQFNRVFTARQKIISVLMERPLSFSEIVGETGMSTSTISKYLTSMMETGEIEKMEDGKYRLTDPELISPIEPSYQEDLERELHRELSLKEIDPISKTERKLHAQGYALDLQPKRSPMKIYEGVLILKDLARSFLLLGKTEREYLSFLAKLYVFSVLKLKDKHASLEEEKTELPFTYIRAAWQITSGKKDQNACFNFNFEKAWNHFYQKLSDELKQKLKERNITSEKIYRKLRIFSFPIAERAELIRQRKI